MATSYRVLGQAAPSATTDTTLYTVPSGTETVISSITVCNRGQTAATFRIAVRPDGATLANQHYIAYDAAIAGNEVIALTLGLTADAGDVVSVYGTSGTLSFGAFGSEIA